MLKKKKPEVLKIIEVWKPPVQELVFSQNVTAKISDISAMGILVLDFNGTMNN